MHEPDKGKLRADFEFYLENKGNFLGNAEYYGKFIAIQNKKIVKTGDDRDKLLTAMLNDGYEMGTFIIQHVIENDDSVQRFTSRVW